MCGAQLANEVYRFGGAEFIDQSNADEMMHALLHSSHLSGFVVANSTGPTCETEPGRRRSHRSLIRSAREGLGPWGRRVLCATGMTRVPPE